MDAAMAEPGERHADASRTGNAGPRGGPAFIGAIKLPGDERSVAHGRLFVSGLLGPGHPEVDRITLSVSELATNAIRHTPSGDGGFFTIRLSAAGALVVAEITNEGVGGARGRPGRIVMADPYMEGGRGLPIVDVLADAWGITEHAGATTVWAEFGSHRTGRPERILFGSG